MLKTVASIDPMTQVRRGPEFQRQSIWGRGWYFSKVTADPKNADSVYVMNTSGLQVILDAGKHWTAIRARPAATIIISSGSILTIRPG